MDFKTILCEDSIIADITDNLTVCVESSGATVNHQQYGEQFPNQLSMSNPQSGNSRK